MADKDLADVPLAFLEFQTHFERPIFAAWDRIPMTEFFEAFRPWNITLEQVSHKSASANLGEAQVIFSLVGVSSVFTLALGGCILFVTNPSWSEADSIIRIATAALGVIRNMDGAAISGHTAALAMHLKPRTRSILQLTARFVNVPHDNGNKGFGFSEYRDGSSYVVDVSALYPEAVFLKVVRSVGADTTMDKIASIVRRDEDEALDLLGLTVA